ncbi:hypothetical protein ARMGADRAFT_1036592 [Armillaria gallica]|uniref:Uncharacterized protein n=1 Tax=Armillaria gallica TaxID=47427 RepID=A0A2H3D9Z2_ARMGA|nr:hypothetical protein ARMGADRAFT_1036592 [Armillaria gallica]
MDANPMELVLQCTGFTSMNMYLTRGKRIMLYRVMSAPNTFEAFCHDWFPPESLSNLKTMLDRSGAIFYGLEVLQFLGTIPSASTPVLNIAVPSRFDGSFASFLCLNGYVSDGFAVDMAIITTQCCIVLYPTLVMELKVALNLGTTGCLEYLNDYGITCLEEIGPIGDEIFGARYVRDSLCYHQKFQDGTDDAFLQLAVHSWSLNLRVGRIGDPSWPVIAIIGTVILLGHMRNLWST